MTKKKIKNCSELICYSPLIYDYQLNRDEKAKTSNLTKSLKKPEPNFESNSLTDPPQLYPLSLSLSLCRERLWICSICNHHAIEVPQRLHHLLHVRLYFLDPLHLGLPRLPSFIKLHNSTHQPTTHFVWARIRTRPIYQFDQRLQEVGLSSGLYPLQGEAKWVRLGSVKWVFFFAKGWWWVWSWMPWAENEACECFGERLDLDPW